LKVNVFNNWAESDILGNPLFDVACFVTNCVDAEIRREFERDIVDFYFDYLTNNYADQGEKLKFTREEVELIFLTKIIFISKAHELYDIALIQQSFICMARVINYFNEISNSYITVCLVCHSFNTIRK
jgi:hypothetical protein